MAKSDNPKSATTAANATGHSAIEKTMRAFDELPPDVRAALSAAHQPSDQMIDVLCNMHRSGFPEAALLKVIAANDAASEQR